MRFRRHFLFFIAVALVALSGMVDDPRALSETVVAQADDRIGQQRPSIRERLGIRRDLERNRRGGRRGARRSAELRPHRGDYVIEVSGYSSPRFANAKGTLTIDLIDNCGDWTLQEKLDVVLVDQAKRTHRSNLLYRATEKSSTDRFVFAYSREHLGDREDFIGDARPVSDGFLVRFTEPKITDLVLPDETLYPVSHFRRVVASAKRQRGRSEYVVFDGANAIAYQAVTEVGLPLRADDDNPRVTAARDMLERSRSDRLPSGTTWPVTTTYYPLDDPYAAPVFSREFLLHESGIIIGLHVDYGDVQMTASLANLDIFDPSRCAQTDRR